MNHVPLRIALDLLGTIALALVILAAREGIRLGSAADGLAEGARRLFLFMDIGLGVWLIALVAIAIRGRRSDRWAKRGITLALLLAGGMINLLVVIAVGFAQQGRFPLTFVGYATDAGICALLAAVPVVSLVHQVVRNPSAGEDGGA